MEREIVKAYKAHGWDAMRTAGSHGPWDVVAVSKSPRNEATRYDWWDPLQGFAYVGQRSEVTTFVRVGLRSERRIYVTVVYGELHTVVLIQCKRRKR